jgi:hypothetical protein
MRVVTALGLVAVAIVALSLSQCGTGTAPPNGDGGVDAGPDMTRPTCAVSSTCPATSPICGSDKFCRTCAGPSDDGQCAMRFLTPRCDSVSGECVACRPDTQATDCTDPAAPSCGSDGNCRPCLAQGECGSAQICNSISGRCVGAADIAYVDNRGMTVTACKAAGGTQDGNSPATAFCDISDGVASLKPNVLVAGSAQPYGAFALADPRAVNVVGPGKSAATPAIVVATSGVLASVTAGRLTIDGFVLGDGTTATTAGGASCNGARLDVHDCKIQKMGGRGVDTTTCDVVVDRSLVTNGAAAGVVTSGGTLQLTRSVVNANSAGGLGIGLNTTFIVQNNFITANTGASDPGVRIDATASGTFSFNSVVGNTRSGDSGGIDCGGVGLQKPIYASIVWGNSTLSLGGGKATQFGGNQCLLSQVVTGTDSYLGAIQLSPSFATDPHLVMNDPANIACCVDKITPPDGGSSTLPNVDIDGDRRPKGAGWEIGADEVQ